MTSPNSVYHWFLQFVLNQAPRGILLNICENMSFLCSKPLVTSYLSPSKTQKERKEKKERKNLIVYLVPRILFQPFLWPHLLLHVSLLVLSSTLAPLLFVTHVRDALTSGPLQICFLYISLQISVWLLFWPFPILYSFKFSWTTLYKIIIPYFPAMPNTPYSFHGLVFSI